MTSKNGTGAARPATVERGASHAHRKLTKRERACFAAAIYDGRIVYQPTRQELAQIFGISTPLIDAARQLHVVIAAADIDVAGRADAAHN
jgi:hypothetical protein